MTKQEFLKKWEGVELWHYYINNVGERSFGDFSVSIYEEDGVWKIHEHGERGVYHKREGTEEEMFAIFDGIVSARKEMQDEIDRMNK